MKHVIISGTDRNGERIERALTPYMIKILSAMNTINGHTSSIVVRRRGNHIRYTTSGIAGILHSSVVREMVQADLLKVTKSGIESINPAHEYGLPEWVVKGWKQVNKQIK